MTSHLNASDMDILVYTRLKKMEKITSKNSLYLQKYDLDILEQHGLGVSVSGLRS